MYWVILISFLILLAISFVVSKPGNKLIKNKKNKTHLLDFLKNNTETSPLTCLIKTAITIQIKKYSP